MTLLLIAPDQSSSPSSGDAVRQSRSRHVDNYDSDPNTSEFSTSRIWLQRIPSDKREVGYFSFLTSSSLARERGSSRLYSTGPLVSDSDNKVPPMVNVSVFGSSVNSFSVQSLPTISITSPLSVVRRFTRMSRSDEKDLAAGSISHTSACPACINSAKDPRRPMGLELKLVYPI